jgi:hypothetical protein
LRRSRRYGLPGCPSESRCRSASSMPPCGSRSTCGRVFSPQSVKSEP